MDNKIIEVQEILFQEMKRLNNENFLLDDNSNKELARSTAIYNQAKELGWNNETNDN